jgi:SAM-dependent methyltransferase
MERPKAEVRDFWNSASCGEEAFLIGETERAAFENEARLRYELEPEILRLAKFDETRGKAVLEIGVGLGSDHQRLVEAGARATGIDLTERAIQYTARRMGIFGLPSRLSVADAENLCFPDETFDAVYSWGVIHHSPDTARAVREIHRVLRPGGTARIMIYHKWSFVGYMLWLRYALLRGRPFTSLATIYDRYLESAGTKAYSVSEAKQLFSAFRDVSIATVLTHGDLLTSIAGQRHTGPALRIARRVWPRRLIRTLAPRQGLFMLIEGRK